MRVWPFIAVLAVAAIPPAFSSPLGGGHLVVADYRSPEESMRVRGGVYEVDPSAPAPVNATLLAGPAPFRGLTNCRIWSAEEILCTDSEADPSGFGADPKGSVLDGYGAVFLLDLADLEVRTLSDGSLYEDTIPGGRPSVFVGPRDVALGPRGEMYVVDFDADPSGLGDDRFGGPGHGAVFLLDPATGRLSLVADGRNYPAGLPPGALSIFESPNSIEVLPDGRLLLADEWANPWGFPTPPFIGSAVFVVDPATGAVDLLVSDGDMGAVWDACLAPDGTFLISDKNADPEASGIFGAIFRFDPAGPTLTPVSTSQYGTIQWIDCRPETNPQRLWAVDARAERDPVSGRQGAVFEVDLDISLPPGSNTLTRSADAEYLFPRSVDQAPAGFPTLASLSPASCCPGETLTLTVTGTGFQADDWLSLGPDVEVQSVMVLSSTQLQATVAIDPAAPPGPRRARLLQDTGISARLDGAFAVDKAPSPAPIAPSLAGGCDVILTLASATIPPCGRLSFDVYRSGVEIATALLAGPWTDTVPENGIWCYQVSTACGSATSPTGTEECVFLDGCGGPPARPGEAFFDPTSAVTGFPTAEDLTWTWSPAFGAAWYRMYRGELGIGGPSLPHATPFSTCTGDPPPECHVDGLSFTDCGVLRDGRAYYYLAIGVSATGTEGLYGNDSNGLERAPGISNCP